MYKRVLLIIVIFSLSSSVVAKKFYKHVDDNGIVHYSDKPPKDTDNFESWQVRVEDSKYQLKIVNRGTQKAPRYYAVNPYYGPLEVHLSFVEQHNVKAEPSWPRHYVVPANSELFLSAIKPIQARQSWSFRYQVQSALGDPNAVHQADFVYALPFPADRHYLLTQGFNGQYSHQHEQSRYAVDIAMPEGSQVLAARGGVVMDIAKDFYDGGAKAKHLARANYVRILHDDGSMAIYAHLQLESVKVAKGQQIKQGQLLALSGSTGFSTGPHLHFAVQINGGLKLQSIPFKWRNKSGNAVSPRVGEI